MTPLLNVVKEDLTPETTKKILDAFARGEVPKPGPQSGRQTSENSAGLTALASKVWIFLFPLMQSVDDLHF